MAFQTGAPTIHNTAASGDVAETILLPGDPLRAKYIAENYLENVRCYNTVRNMLGFTGFYKGKEISVQGTGMGMPSMAIYAYELVHFYGCRNLIRIGTCGTISKELNINDVVIGMGACHDSNLDEQYELPGKYAPICSFYLLEKFVNKARELKIPVHVGNISSGSAFYSEKRTNVGSWEKMNVLAGEMEAAALYMIAARARVNALCILTVTDSRRTGEMATSEQRETGTKQMIELALEASLTL
ncbi:MAG: purine-nucleoside phosphorylase [Saccharofermentanales bacterium]|jgi:purine-nucleoside phosphorylase